MIQEQDAQSPAGSVLTLVVRAPHSLHVRPAARLVRLIQDFEADLTLIREGARADAKSILDVLGLSVMEGDRLEVQAAGSDAGEALEVISRLFAGSFEE